MAKQIKLSKTKSKQICEWFFKVVETQRTLIELNREGESKYGITLCLGNEKQIQILNPDFDKVVEALTSVYDEAFVGEIKNKVSEDYENKEFICRSFKYAEFTIGTVIREEG